MNVQVLSFSKTFNKPVTHLYFQLKNVCIGRDFVRECYGFMKDGTDEVFWYLYFRLTVVFQGF